MEVCLSGLRSNRSGYEDCKYYMRHLLCRHVRRICLKGENGNGNRRKIPGRDYIESVGISA